MAAREGGALEVAVMEAGGGAGAALEVAAAVAEAMVGCVGGWVAPVALLMARAEAHQVAAETGVVGSEAVMEMASVEEALRAVGAEAVAGMGEQPVDEVASAACR